MRHNQLLCQSNHTGLTRLTRLVSFTAPSPVSLPEPPCLSPSSAHWSVLCLLIMERTTCCLQFVILFSSLMWCQIAIKYFLIINALITRKIWANLVALPLAAIGCHWLALTSKLALISILINRCYLCINQLRLHSIESISGKDSTHGWHSVVHVLRADGPNEVLLSFMAFIVQVMFELRTGIRLPVRGMGRSRAPSEQNRHWVATTWTALTGAHFNNDLFGAKI